MKKFLVILMVVAMVSFLFVGCMPSVTPPVEEEEEEEVAVAKTDTPYITNIGDGKVKLYSTETQYAKNCDVMGVGVTGAVIKVYINGKQSGVGNTAANGDFDITTSMIKLTEGVKKLYVTATVPGLAESDKSTEYTFTVDLTAPKIASAIADSSANSIKVTFNEAVNMSITAGDMDHSALLATNWWVNGVELDVDDDVFEKVSTKVVRITPKTVVETGGTVFSVTCELIADSLGNEMGVGTVSTYVGVTVK